MFSFAPAVKPYWRWVRPGAALALVLCLAISFGLRASVAHFSNYNTTDGSVGVILLMLQPYRTGVVLLHGAEVNSEIEHAAVVRGATTAKAEGERAPKAAWTDRSRHARNRSEIMKSIRIGLLVPLFFASMAMVEASPVTVRFPEGSAQGFLILRGPKGEELATGELQQHVHDEAIHSRLVFRFKDGSQHDETVVFSQRKTFGMRQYRLVQRGPSFPMTLEAFIDGKSGRYKVTANEVGSKGDTFEGQLELPPDVSNGMLSVLLKNLPNGTTRTAHVVAFTPKPQVVEVEVTPDGEALFFVGDTQRQASRYRLKPKLGIVGALASLLGRDVPEYRYWILTTGSSPAFLAFEGPLYAEGPIWRVELASPRWRTKSRPAWGGEGLLFAGQATPQTRERTLSRRSSHLRIADGRGCASGTHQRKCPWRIRSSGKRDVGVTGSG